MRSGLLGVILAAIVLFVPGPMSAFAQEPVPPALVVDSADRFGLDLYARLKGGPGNLFFSPYGILTALTMVQAGAGGNTAGEMARALYIPIEGEAWHKASFEHRKMLNMSGGCAFTVANSLWGQKGHVFLPAYLSLIENYYGGEFDQVDFGQAFVAAARINAWVSEKTAEKIKDIVSPDSLGDMTRLVLVNAVYFKGKWDMPFKKIHTENRRFSMSPQNTKITAMMNQVGNFFYAENDLAQVLELLYEGRDLSMVIVLPRKADGLSEVEGLFDMERYKDWMAGLSEKEVALTLPKFRNTATFSLNGTLAAMGIVDAFSGAANFSGMSDEGGGLQVSDVLHKTYVDITEEGTEAAAVTAVVMKEGMALEEPSATAVPFVADHPFLYVIRDRRTDSILFMGRIVDPDVGARPVGDVLSGVWGEVMGQALQSQKKIHSEADKPEGFGD